MKKIFTFLAASLFAAGAYAQTGVTNVDKTMVIYMTNDTITSEMGEVEDPDTGEPIETVVPKYWMGSSMVDGFNACGLPLTGTSSTQTQYMITTRQDYVDSETGFNMPKGSYRGVFIDGTIGLTGTVGEGKVNGFSNVKSMVLYFIPIPTAWKADGSISHQDYPTGRVQAKYVTVAEDGTVTAASNQSYREIHMDMTDDVVNDPAVAVVKGTKVANFERKGVTDLKDILDVTVDRPVKVEVNLQNKLDGVAYEEIFQNPTNKQGEYADFYVDGTTNDYEHSLFFAKTGTCCPYYSTDANPHGDHGSHDSDAASGYCCWCGKWGDKVEWTPETVVQLAVKKRMYLVGVALVSATEGASSKFMNAADKLKASWKDSDVAYNGKNSVVGINMINANASVVATPAKYVENGHVVIVKNGKKFNVAGAQLQ